MEWCSAYAYFCEMCINSSLFPVKHCEISHGQLMVISVDTIGMDTYILQCTDVKLLTCHKQNKVEHYLH